VFCHFTKTFVTRLHFSGIVQSNINLKLAVAKQLITKPNQFIYLFIYFIMYL